MQQEIKEKKKPHEKNEKVGEVIIRSEDEVTVSIHMGFKCLPSAIFNFDPFSTCHPNVLHSKPGRDIYDLCRQHRGKRLLVWAEQLLCISKIGRKEVDLFSI